MRNFGVPLAPAHLPAPALPHQGVIVNLTLLKSKTVWGSVLIGLGQVLPVLQSGLLGPKAAAIATGVGAILTGLGVRTAIAKNGTGK